jgi:NAD(P)-dependent dehydrogenase (short-subunit alcohol dehydrogenase family)
MDRFKTRTVVITGAGSGFGRGLALEFARMGWRVAVNDINGARAVESARLVDGAGGQGLAITCDVSRPEEVQALADAVVARWGTVDIVVNNAGVPVCGYMEKVPLEDWKFEIDLMLMAVVYGCRTFIPIFRNQGWGHIVNTASAAGIVSLPGMAPYNAAKAGVIALSETLAGELTGSNIGVTVVCPTFFKTNLLDEARFADEHTARMANCLFDRFCFGCTESVSRATITAIRKNRLYVVPQPDAKLFRLMKRMAPETFHKVVGFMYSRGILDRILGV